MFNYFDASTLYGIGGIIATVLSSFFFYWLGQRFTRRSLHSVERERILRAKELLLTIIESYIVEKSEISVNVMNDRIDALERKENVHLRSEVTPISLLQDVALRLDSTQYLSLEQKKEYSLLINRMIDGINHEIALNPPTSTMKAPQFNDLREKIKANDADGALQQLEQIELNYKQKINGSDQRRVRYFQFMAIGLFFWFWIYNGVVGFAPLISENFLADYHWWLFGVGMFIGLSYLFNPFGKRFYKIMVK